MTNKTEKQLNKRIEQLEQELDAAETRATAAEEKVDNLTAQIESDTYGWAMPRAWEDRDLPVPRLELRWEVVDEYSRRCVYVLVYRHLLDDIVGKPLGETISRGSRTSATVRGDGVREPLTIDTPFRDGAHAFHDAKQLRLPLFVTSDDHEQAFVVDLNKPHITTAPYRAPEGK